MDKMGERLARIETSQTHLAKQLDRVIVSMDRMIRVEEHVEQHAIECSKITNRLVSVEAELATWKSVRKFFGIIFALTGIFSAWALAWYHDKI